MKTLGERIKQAREALGWSGEVLAKRVGYKTQSGISNLESRATGTGGNKIGKIAQELGVPLDWLMYSPDSEKVPFQDQPALPLQANLLDGNHRQQIQPKDYDQWTLAAVNIMCGLKEYQREGALAALKTYVGNLGPPRVGQTLQVAG
jgi:transcriptional regulator with XRE-family HTH domain